MDDSTLEQRIERMKKRNEFFYDEDIALCIRSLEAWQKVKEELKEEMTGLDMFIEKEHTIRWCLHVIDEALGEVARINMDNVVGWIKADYRAESEE